uniref:Uncharacterized protein n=1 Tax=Moniliophthora roreri TaxID=221103 RepID=A0A0W0EYW9_MONRR
MSKSLVDIQTTNATGLLSREDPDFNSSIPYPESHPDAAQNDV